MPKKHAGGRPRQGEEVKLAPLNMRTSPQLRGMIEEAAAATGRSLTQEVETRLWISFSDDAWMGTWRIKSLVKMLGMSIEQIEQMTGKKWTEDRQTWEAVSVAAERLLRWDRPPAPLSPKLETATARMEEANRVLDEARDALESFQREQLTRLEPAEPITASMFARNAVMADEIVAKATEAQRRERELFAALMEAWEFARAASAEVQKLLAPTLEKLKAGRELGNKLADDWFERIGPKQLRPSS